MANSKQKKFGKNKPYFERQRAVTAKNKATRAAKRAKRLAGWVAKGVKKNGKKVLTAEQRKEHANHRRAVRAERKAEARAMVSRERQARYEARQFKGKAPKAKPENEDDVS